MVEGDGHGHVFVLTTWVDTQGVEVLQPPGLKDGDVARSSRAVRGQFFLVGWAPLLQSLPPAGFYRNNSEFGVWADGLLVSGPVFAGLALQGIQ